MAGGKYRPNTYDVNLVKRHDDNSAINSDGLPGSPGEGVRSASFSRRV